MKIKDTPKVDRTKLMTRQCACCGGDILVKVFADGRYIGGNYFHSITECNPIGHCPDIYTKSVSSPRLSASSPHNSALGEYWECDKCYIYEDE